MIAERREGVALQLLPATQRAVLILREVLGWSAREVADLLDTALAALLRDDVTLTMPPQAIQIVGRDAVAGFFATVPADGRLDLIRLVVTRAAGHRTNTHVSRPFGAGQGGVAFA